MRAAAALLVAMALAPAAHAQQASANPCQMGGFLAHKAYLEGTYDARRPDMEQLHYLVDYWSDMMVVAHDKQIAHAAVEFIAPHMKTTGMRQPHPAAVYELTYMFIAANCAP